MELYTDKVQIDIEESEYIEKLFYQYNASKDIIAHLMSNQGVNFNILQHYIDISEQRFTELELAKKEIFKRYIEKSIDDYDYLFDFENHAILYRLGIK